MMRGGFVMFFLCFGHYRVVPDARWTMLVLNVACGASRLGRFSVEFS